MTIGQAIRRRRQALGMTQTHLAEICGISRTAISLIESDDKKPLVDTLDKIAPRLLCTTADLINDREEAEDHGNVTGSQSPVQPHQSK